MRYLGEVMKKTEILKVLVIPLTTGMRREVKNFLHGKVIQVEFSSQSELKKIPKGELRKYQAIGLVTRLSDQMLLTLQEGTPQLRSCGKRGKR